MYAIKIIVDNETNFKRIYIGTDIEKVSIEWKDNLSENQKDYIKHELYNYIYNFVQKHESVKVLDISRLVGLRDAYYPIRYLHKIYYPDSIEEVRICDNGTLKKVYARGAKKIIINNVPTLESVEYGRELEELSLMRTGITNIVLHKNIKLINEAFKGCDKLKSVILKSGTDIPPSAFEGCVNLYEITLPNDLLAIEPKVFSGCSNLRYVYGGKSIKQVFPSAFDGCYNLRMMECKDFFKFTNLKISDKQWIDKIRPYKPLTDVKNHIKKFVTEFREIEIDNPEEYIADNFFYKTENHFGFVVTKLYKPDDFVVWSLSHNRYIATKGIQLYLHQDDFLTFTIERKPVVTIEDNLYFKFNMTYIDNTSKLKIVKHNDNIKEHECFLEYFSPKESLLDYYKRVLKIIDGLNVSKIIDSYSIIERTWYQIRPGRDDYQFYERIAKSDYSDIYLEEFLPQEDNCRYECANSPWGFDDKEENQKLQQSADIEARYLKEKAYKNYSRDTHICKLLEEYVNKRSELGIYLEAKYHIEAVKNFICYSRIDSDSLTELYNLTIEDVLRGGRFGFVR